jgi:hypothetical protein
MYLLPAKQKTAEDRSWVRPRTKDDITPATGAVAGSFTVNCGEPTLDFHVNTAEGEPLGDSFSESNRRYLYEAVNEEREAERNRQA